MRNKFKSVKVREPVKGLDVRYAKIKVGNKLLELLARRQKRSGIPLEKISILKNRFLAIMNSDKTPNFAGEYSCSWTEQVGKVLVKKTFTIKIKENGDYNTAITSNLINETVKNDSSGRVRLIG